MISIFNYNLRPLNTREVKREGMMKASNQTSIARGRLKVPCQGSWILQAWDLKPSVSGRIMEKKYLTLVKRLLPTLQAVESVGRTYWLLAKASAWLLVNRFKSCEPYLLSPFIDHHRPNDPIAPNVSSLPSIYYLTMFSIICKKKRKHPHKS